MALRQQATQDHAETPLASTALAHASACTSFVNVYAFETVLSKCDTQKSWESKGCRIGSPEIHWQHAFQPFTMF